MYLTVRLSIMYLMVRLSTVYLTYLTVRLSIVYLTVRLSIVYLTVRLSIVHLTVRLSIVYLTVRLSIVYLTYRIYIKMAYGNGIALHVFYLEWLTLSEKQTFGNVWDRLSRTMGAEDLAYKMLKGCPRDRTTAEDGLLHKFFSTLPGQLYQLSDVRSIFTVPGLCLKPEIRDLLIPHQKVSLPAAHHKPW
ncbi:cyclin-dependent kinase 15-like [Pseudophryne corroboree]|uniref:cyclin-dependent kinase 15-like n=1 Tax=Pseudophryne corroboree TaxID=495146 RepID=UPI003081BDB2